MIIAVFLGGLVLLFLLGFGAPYAIGLVSLLVLLITRGIGDFPFDMVATKMAKAATGSGRTPPISKRPGMDCSRNKATASRV